MYKVMNEDFGGLEGARKIGLYTMAHPKFFEKISNLNSQTNFYNLLEKNLPSDWNIEPFELWYMATPPHADIPPQGFKIHVSATTDIAEDIIKIVAPECARHHTAFKVVRDPTLLSIEGSKSFGRAASSKFFTIYPQSLDIFKAVIDLLYKQTRGYEAPYILSDRCYKDSKIVYYRYGGFKDISRLTTTGSRKLYIRDPRGRLVPDKRLPYFQLPEWVKDPFVDMSTADDSQELILHNRYEIQGALAFSNCGGVYKAFDRLSHDTVVIKEARHLTTAWASPEWRIEAVDILQREAKILDKLNSVEGIPKLIDVFQQWEHDFIVEEYIEAMPFSSYRARPQSNLLPFTGEKETARQFSKSFSLVAERLIRRILQVHRAGIIIGDIAPQNTFINPESKAISLIDFENAHMKASDDASEEFSLRWATPGYEHPARAEANELEYDHDWYAVGMMLYGLLLPIQPLFDIKPSTKKRFLDKLVSIGNVPEQVPQIIQLLLRGHPLKALNIVSNWRVDATVNASCNDSTKDAKDPAQCTRASTLGEIRNVLENLSNYVVEGTTPERKDRLWPSDFKVFSQHPASVAYGACGTALFLNSRSVSLPRGALNWLNRITLSPDVCPPGLFVGLAGIAYTFSRLGRVKQAKNVMGQLYRSNLAFNDPSLYFGAAGWGYVSLYMYQLTGEDIYRDKARDAGNFLVETAETSAAGWSWRIDWDNASHFGIAYGSSGIALFLTYLAKATGKIRYVKAARKAINYELSGAVYPFSDDLPRWKASENSKSWEPYWINGGAGIGACLVRMAAVLEDDKLLESAIAVAYGAYNRFSVLPGQFQGLSGIGELFLDLHNVTGDEQFYDKALNIADSVLCFRLEQEEGTAFPGRFLARISNGYGYGGAGIGLFLNRLFDGGRRELHDMPPYFGSEV